MIFVYFSGATVVVVEYGMLSFPSTSASANITLCSEIGYGMYGSTPALRLPLNTGFRGILLFVVIFIFRRLDLSW